MDKSEEPFLVSQKCQKNYPIIQKCRGYSLRLNELENNFDPRK